MAERMKPSQRGVERTSSMRRRAGTGGPARIARARDHRTHKKSLDHAMCASRLGITLGTGALPISQEDEMATSPTVVLVHGAFADASGYAGVIRQLQAREIAVRAPMNPL